MKIEELLKFEVRENGVIIRAVRKKLAGGLEVPVGAEMTMENTNYYAEKVSPTIEDIRNGDEVLVTGAAFIPLLVEDRKPDTAYFYCPSTFIKLVLVCKTRITTR